MVGTSHFLKIFLPALLALIQVSTGQQQGLLNNLTLIGSTRDATFYTKDVILQWAQAVSFCTQHGLQLATMPSPDEERFINNWASHNYNDSSSKVYIFWLNGHLSSDYSQWNWLDTGKTIPFPTDNFNPSSDPYQNWFEGMPYSNHPDSPWDCLAMALNTTHTPGGWYSVNCNGACRPLCEKKGTVLPTGMRTTVSRDLLNSKNELVFVLRSSQISGGTFFTTETLMDAQESKELCESSGLALAHIDSSSADSVLLTAWITEQITLGIKDWLSGGTPAFQTLNCITNGVETGIAEIACPTLGRPLCIAVQ